MNHTSNLRVSINLLLTVICYFMVCDSITCQAATNFQKVDSSVKEHALRNPVCLVLDCIADSQSWALPILKPLYSAWVGQKGISVNEGQTQDALSYPSLSLSLSEPNGLILSHFCQKL